MSAPSIGDEFDVGEAAEEVDTLGGYLVMRAGHVPVRGEFVPGPRPFRGRSARRRSAPGQAGEDLPAQGPPTRTRRADPPTLVAAPQPRRSRRRPMSHAGRSLRIRRAAVKPKALDPRASCLAWGWRRRLIALRRRRALGAGAGAAQRLAGVVPDLSGRWSG